MARRILFLLPTLYGGGAERVVTTLLRHLDRVRFRPVLAVVDTKDAAYRNDIPADVDLIDLKCSRVRYALPRIVRLIWRLRPHVVFSTLGHLNLALAIARPLLPDGTIYCAREAILVSQLNAEYQRTAIWNWAYRRFYRRFDLIICPSGAMRDDLAASYDLPAAKLLVVNNPVDVSRVRRLANAEGLVPARSTATGSIPICLLAAGRLSRQKGFDLLIESLALASRPELRLTILGEGPLRSDLERLARERGVLEQVRFAGFLVNPYPLIRQADAFVLSSRFEGLPNVVLEALACGTPVISTPAAGVSEILDGVTGCTIVDSVSAEALAHALKNVTKGIRVPEEAASRYDVGTIVRKYEEALG